MKERAYNRWDDVQPKVSFRVGPQDDLSADFLWYKWLKKVSDNIRQLTWSIGRKTQQHEERVERLEELWSVTACDMLKPKQASLIAFFLALILSSTTIISYLDYRLIANRMLSGLSNFKFPPNFANSSLRHSEAENVLKRIPDMINKAVKWFEGEFNRADETEKCKREVH